MNYLEAEALTSLQRGLPLCENAFEEMGKALGTTGHEVAEIARRALANGQVRRFGAVFDARRLGYRSALCAMDIPETLLEEIAGRVTPHPGVTHAYQRGWPTELERDVPGGPGQHPWPNFWFTLATPAACFNDELAKLREACLPHAIYDLPASRRFKIDVVFDLRTRERDECTVPGVVREHSGPAPILRESDIALIHLLQGSVRVYDEPFEGLAREAGLETTALLRKLREWREQGILRRFGVLLRHREVGFKANGMCCWNVSDAEIAEAGRSLAAAPEVTHCYERAPFANFPFRLYAMIHTPTWEGTLALFQRLSRETGLEDGQLLCSIREFKKSSMQYWM